MVKERNITVLLLMGMLIYIVFLQECSGPSGNNFGSSYIDTLRHEVDTVVITKVDTVQLPPIIRVIEADIPEPVVLHDTIKTVDSIFIHAYHEYTTDVTDSLIEGKVISKVDGKLLDQRLEYIPKFPKYIYRVDSVLVTSETEIQKSKSLLFLGGELGGNATNFNISPKVSVLTKGGYLYSYRYGLLDKTHNVSISKKISFTLRR